MHGPSHNILEEIIKEIMYQDDKIQRLEMLRNK